MPAGREIELKLAIAPGHVAAVTRHRLWAAIRVAPPTHVRMHAIYIDTDDGTLAAAGVALRLRREGARWMQTLKGPPESGSGAGMAARREYEQDRGSGARTPPLDPAQWAATPWRALLDRAQQRGLRARFVTAFRRRATRVALPGDTTATVAVDVGEIRAGTRDALPIRELEIELEEGRIESIYELAQALARDLPLRVEPRSKAARGFALVHALRQGPARAEHPALGTDDSAAAALQTLLRSCARQIGDNAAGLLDDDTAGTPRAHPYHPGDDPEWIHQMRIGTRRLRACAALLRKVVPGERLVGIVDDARWLARALGPARDLDVLALQTLPARAGAARHRDSAGAPADAALSPVTADDAQALAALSRRLGPARAEAQAAACAAVASPRFTRLLLATGALASAPMLGAEGAQARALARPARRFASPWLRRRHRKLLRRARGLATASPEARHEVRLAAKRLRYVTEFFAGVFRAKHVRAYRRALARLQDELGAEVDAAVAVRIALAIEGPASAAAQVLAGAMTRDAGNATARLMKRWEAFRACTPFFERG
jgi:inorganic triphosphatase YgiF